MNFKQQLKIKDMASSRLSGIKARAARRDAELESQARQKQESAQAFEKYLDGMKTTLLPLIFDTWETIQDLLENGFEKEVNEELSTLFGIYGIQSNGDESGAEYMNYVTWLDEGGSGFMVGLWLPHPSEQVDYAICIGDDIDWYSQDTEESYKSFMDVAVDFQPEIKELITQVI